MTSSAASTAKGQALGAAAIVASNVVEQSSSSASYASNSSKKSNYGDLLIVNSDGFIKGTGLGEGNSNNLDKIVLEDGTNLKLNDGLLDQKRINELIGEKENRNHPNLSNQRLFISLKNSEIANIYNTDGNIVTHYKQLNSLPLSIPGHSSRISYIFGLATADFDFIYSLAGIAKQNMFDVIENGTFRTSYDSSPVLFKFESGFILYNLHDAGNFMTGNAFMLVNVSQSLLRLGANIYSTGDSAADQSAISDGYDYKGVIYNKK